jgi:hypothetical protein
MENKGTKIIEEEIRQFKLYKIQLVEAKMREYGILFQEIKEHAAIKLTKNASSNFLRIILLTVTIAVFSAGFLLLFPDKMIEIFEGKGIYFSTQMKLDFKEAAPYLRYILFSISLLFGSISILLKKNIKKRNTIHDLSKLINEVINYMDDNVKEDKKKYEYFVDSAAEIENRQKNNSTQSSN